MRITGSGFSHVWLLLVVRSTTIGRGLARRRTIWLLAILLGRRLALISLRRRLVGISLGRLIRIALGRLTLVSLGWWRLIRVLLRRLAVWLRWLALILLSLRRILLRRLAVRLLVLPGRRSPGGRRSLAGRRLLVAGIIAALRGLLAVLGRLLGAHDCRGTG